MLGAINLAVAHVTKSDKSLFLRVDAVCQQLFEANKIQFDYLQLRKLQGKQDPNDPHQKKKQDNNLFKFPTTFIFDFYCQSMSWFSQSPQPQHQPQYRSKMQQYRVQIREKQLNAMKNRIRQQILGSNAIEELFEALPRDIQSVNQWSNEVYKAYSQARRHSLCNQQILDIFKLLEKFPIRNTLLLLEIVIIRANEANVDFLFQQDVMRVLHGFINFTGKEKLIRGPQSVFSFEEFGIINEVVITQAVQAIEHNSEEDNNYSSRLELARITLRIIAQLCRKAYQIRNFVVINHKTYPFCLKTHQCFEKDIDNQFYYFLESVTYIPFDRCQDQFERITKNIIQLFYHAKNNVRIQLLDERKERSNLTAWESLVNALRNLFEMDNRQFWVQLQAVENSSGTVTLGMIVDIVAQCNSVMELPAAHQQNQALMPIKLMEATLHLSMSAVEALSRLFPDILRHPLYDHYVSEMIRFLRNRKLESCNGSFVMARRLAIFQLDQFVFEIKSDEARINSFFTFNHQDQNDSLIALIAYLFQSDTDFNNKIRLCKLTQDIMECFPACATQQQISRCQLFPIILGRLVQLSTWRGDAFQLSQQSLKIHIFRVLLTFLKNVLPQIMQRLPFYTSLLGQYTQRIQRLMLHQYSLNQTSTRPIQRLMFNQQSLIQKSYCYQLLQWLGDNASES